MTLVVAAQSTVRCMFCRCAIKPVEKWYRLLGGAAVHPDCYRRNVRHEDDPPDEPEDFYQ